MPLIGPLAPVSERTFVIFAGGFGIDCERCGRYPPTMSLVDSYNRVSSTLRDQVQGTCGIYSFYTAVCILRDMDPSCPTVPSPKKSEAGPGATVSLRQYAKRELKSGQGEILTEVEMTTFVKAWGYKVATFVEGTYSKRQDFITLQTKANHPVLVPYLADEDNTGIIPVSTVTAGAGAHWSLIIGTKGKDVIVVEPNAPRAVKEWAMDSLLKSNAAADSVKFVRFWAKVVMDKPELQRQLKPKAARGPKVDSIRSINPVPDKDNWTPSWKSGQPGYRGTGEVSLYDLGGVGGSRHTNQKLNNVLIAILPP